MVGRSHVLGLRVVREAYRRKNQGRKGVPERALCGWDREQARCGCPYPGQ